MGWSFRYWMRPEPPGRDIRTDEQRETRITTIIDRHGFNWRVYIVAASGFFTGSYNLFATNVIAPSLAYVYWNGDKGANPQVNHTQAIDLATLAGSLFGMLVFGHLSDRFGRQRLYGIELIIVIVATMGMAQSSDGFRTCDNPNKWDTCKHSMSGFEWIVFWRIVLGVGIGAEYPMSAIISAEWSSKKSRARTLAAVFMMQPLGQLMAYLVGLAALRGFGKSRQRGYEDQDPNQTALEIDSVWRCIIGVGAIPALLAILARLSIPETPRYTLLIEQNDAQAQRDTAKVYGHRGSITNTESLSNNPALVSGCSSQILVGNTRISKGAENGEDEIEVAQEPNGNEVRLWKRTVDSAAPPIEDIALETLSINAKADKNGKKGKRPKRRNKKKDRKRIQQFTWPRIHQFFIQEGNWRVLAGTSLTWGILDIVFYGLGLSRPRIISKIWMDHETNVNITATSFPAWNSDFENEHATIYQVLKTDAWHSMVTISIGSLLGSIIILKLIKYIPRSAWLVWSFLGLAVLFAMAGGTFFIAYQKPLHVLTIFLYVLIQLFFNLGPNTITFMLPAEVFPTRYRGTCYGIAAASGKLGSIIIQLALPNTKISEPSSSAVRFAAMLIAFAAIMSLGALLAWAWIPDVQDTRRIAASHDIETQRPDSRPQRRMSDRWELPSKALEVLGQGKEGLERGNEQVIGLRAKLMRIWRRE